MVDRLAGVTRRSALAGLAVATTAAVAGVVGEEEGWWHRGEEPAAPPEPASVAAWVRTRGAHHQVAHRGSGDVLPEHTLPAYRAARDWGARAMEVSVGRTSDGVLVCMHDSTYDRTTDLRGKLSSQPSSVLEHAGVLQPQLGPAWTRPPLPVVPRLEDVLTEFGGTMVLCLEAKDDAAYPDMMAMAERHGLRASTVVKAYQPSRRIEQAQQAGYPVFAYADSPAPDRVAALAARLRPEQDALGIAAQGPDGPLTDDAVRAAVALGVPVWVYPVHRRSEVGRLFSLGVAGVVSSSYGYTSGAVRVLPRDSWAGKRIASGEMTRRPEQPSLAPSWTGEDELTLERGSTQYLTLGQLCPVPAATGSYSVELQARWPAAADPAGRVALAFGHPDDRYWEPGAGDSTGYDAGLRADGRLELRAHTAGAPGDTVLAGAASPPPAPGAWVPLRLTVTPSTLTWSRTDVDGASVTAQDTRTRGGYLHLGRSGAPAAFRRLTVH